MADLVLHELDRLLVLLADKAVGTDHFADHVHIAAVDAHLGDVIRIERQLEMPVLIVEDEVGDDVGRRVGSALGIEVAGLGRQVPDLGDGLAEIVLGNLQARHQFFVMLLDKLVEIGSQYLARQPAGPRIDRDLRHLQQQALLEIAGAYAGGFQFMDDAEQFLQLLGRGLDPDREGDVVGHGLQVAAQVTVLVDAPDQVYGQFHLALGKVAEPQLLDQVLLQRPSLGQEDRALLVVLRVVIDTAFIGRGVVFTQILVDRNLLGLFLVLGSTILFLQHDIVFDLLFDTLFELHGGQLQQLDHLNLLGRELLLKRQYLFLINSHTFSKLRIRDSEFGFFLGVSIQHKRPQPENRMEKRDFGTCAAQPGQENARVRVMQPVRNSLPRWF